MDETTRTRRLLEWAFATFHTAAFILGLVEFLYARNILGSLLGSLNTLAGFALFGYLWAVTGWTTRRAFRAAAPGWVQAGGFCDQPVKIGTAIFEGTVWGTANGLLFFCGLLVLALAFLILPAVFVSPLDPGVILIYTLIGSIAAAAIGGVVGLILAVVDSLLIFWVCPSLDRQVEP